MSLLQAATVTANPWQDVLKLLNQGDFYAAENAIDELVRHQGESQQSHHMRAILYQKRGDRRQAIRELELSIHQFGEDLTTLQSLGSLLIEDGDRRRGMQYLKRARDLTPRNRRLARAIDRMERENSAQKSYRTEQSGRFLITFENTWEQPQIKDRLARRLEQALSELERKLWSHEGQSIPVVLYPTRRVYRDVLDAPAWSAAAWDNKLRIPISESRQMSEAAILPLLRHELTHYLIATRVRGRQVPAWLNEGMAQIAERRGTMTARSYFKSLGRKRKLKLFSLEQLQSSFSRFYSPAMARLAYAQALMTTTYLKDKYGSNADVKIIEEIAAGKSARLALEKVTGVSYGDFGEDFPRWLLSELGP